MAKPKKAEIKAYKELSVKQQRFVDYYDGNAAEAARKAGYKNAKVIGCQNLTKLNILAALKGREERERKPKIATREERQAFWTSVLLGTETQPMVKGYGEGGEAIVVDIPPKMPDRLKASELLGRSQADFTDKIAGVDKDGEIAPIMVVNLVRAKPVEDDE